jgi:23S rRNA pseudouridine1911/1915/1917 synthase
MSEIKIIFEDENLLILDKPAGITVNKADTTKDEPTIQDWVEEKYKIHNTNPIAGDANDFNNRAGIVHRIDKETSGILVVAKDPVSFANLQLQFKERKVEKTYLALVHGLVNPPKGEIIVPVGRLPWNRHRFGVLAGGKEAQTFYKTLSIYELKLKKQVEKLTLLELKPKTGRTHQIRVHLKYINHPIFADPLYAGRKTARDDRKLLSRVFLHAAGISFIHPKTNLKLNFESLLSSELKNLLSSLQQIS